MRAPLENPELALRIGRKLKSKRNAAKLTGRALEAKSGVSNAFISQMENGKSAPSVDTLVLLANALGIRPGWFFEDDDQECQLAPMVGSVLK